jgi:hypothetical protein
MTQQSLPNSRARLVDPPRFHGDQLLPHLTKTPWKGFSPGDWPREKPLPKCPSQRCRRAKQCIDAKDDLYCKREYLSDRDARALYATSKLAQAVKALPTEGNDIDPSIREAWAANVTSLHKENDAKLTELWKDGYLDHLYGKYQPRGAKIAPPVRRYMEEKSSFRAKKLGDTPNN